VFQDKNSHHEIALYSVEFVASMLVHVGIEKEVRLNQQPFFQTPKKSYRVVDTIIGEDTD
jgi:hypothetical protein